MVGPLKSAFLLTEVLPQAASAPGWVADRRRALLGGVGWQRPTKVPKHPELSNEERWAGQYERVKVKVPRGQAGVDTLNNYRQIANMGLGSFYPAASTTSHLRGDPRGSADDGSSWGAGKSSLGGAESSLGDAKSSLGDAKSSLGDNIRAHLRGRAGRCTT